MSFVNLLANDVWSEGDILNRVRSVTRAQVSAVRQDELRTIMLGGLAGMRQPTEAEMGEIMLVKQLTEQGAADAEFARARMALLLGAIAAERALAEQANPEATPEQLQAAQDCIDSASPEVLELVALRQPPQTDVPPNP